MNILTLCYLLASITFIIGLKMLSGPASARKGNLVAAAGMSVAVLGTIFLYRDDAGQRLGNYGWIFGGICIGGLIGTLAAKRVKMTAMPEMVSMFNGMGGLCAALIAIVEFDHFRRHAIIVMEGTTASGMLIPVGLLIIILLGLIIGSVSFSGSMIAWGKLNGKIKDRSFKGQHLLNLLVLLAIVAGAVYLLFCFDLSLMGTLFYLILGLALLYGVLFVLPIGGADMPVVISLLNSFTGVAAACGGFLYDNKVMLTGGILVGAAGTLLTVLMCRAMNRSLANVLIGSFGGGNTVAKSGEQEQGAIKEISISDTAVVMGYANRVLIVPGYGLAVAQAQHVCHELERLLEQRGVEVLYAIHPVAGRMPGHMNVLLAEADVPYEKLLEMEQANELFPQTDVVLVLGANDVVNPAAKTDPASPIYGMPVLEVEQAKTVIVNKRSMKPGYAGIDNALFSGAKTSMLFGDAKKVLQDLVTELKNS
ncbi:NAD(P)(+) transhydrogenase (Re/Si-specific) subunit beta [Niabella pedocola]|uniref:NAD(P) transhydrogenase subunit beta n=1 Tax=Niabella pedocola TaxID=1752077 RepID=A0ABS8PKD0_9BACT|nr:NAD(P)(+) transhydrogenase (Re/Si-specific) subunit beta [Niabella pedocola]MCD2421456.1 NAD(P)(+) transhydrogenase (Re/Si-specific) subunit beta [Niabella pedocola]